jgi:hypothetical protein
LWLVVVVVVMEVALGQGAVVQVGLELAHHFQ